MNQPHRKPMGRIAFEVDGQTIEVEVRTIRASGVEIRAAQCDVDAAWCRVKSVENGQNVYLACEGDCVYSGEAEVRP